MARDAAPPEGDSLDAHRRVAGALWHDLPRPLMLRLEALGPRGPRSPNDERDPHRAFIRERDAQRDGLRAERLDRALCWTREAISGGTPASWPLLQQAQALVLGVDAPCPFRRGPAFAKGGHERYDYAPELEDELADKLQADASDDAHALVRAARGYLDICFYHPFDDGNARAARLLLDAHLTAARFTPALVAPLFVLSRPAGHREAYLDFLRLLITLVERSV